MSRRVKFRYGLELSVAAAMTPSSTIGRDRPRAVIQTKKVRMDEPAEMNFVLSQVRESLPEEVLRTCESLNGHGEWEMALGHCVHHLSAVSPAAKMALEATAQRFGASDAVLAAIAKL